MSKATTDKSDSALGTDPLSWLEEENNIQPTENTDANESEQAAVEEESLDNHYDLGQILNIRDLDSLNKNLGTLLKQHNKISLDASHIEKVDAVSLQTLAAFYTSGPAHGVDIEWTGHSDSFYECVKLLGLTETLGID